MHKLQMCLLRGLILQYVTALATLHGSDQLVMAAKACSIPERPDRLLSLSAYFFCNSWFPSRPLHSYALLVVLSHHLLLSHSGNVGLILCEILCRRVRLSTFLEKCHGPLQHIDTPGCIVGFVSGIAPVAKW
jgi:hypothetical protein